MNIIKKVIHENEPVMLLDSVKDVVRHRETMDTSTDSKVYTNHRCAKGGHHIIEFETKNEYLYPLKNISSTYPIHS